MRRIVMKSDEPCSRRRRCMDCYHMQAALSWWCTNKEAVRNRHTNMPDSDIVGCPFWEPCMSWSKLKWYQRIAVRLNPDLLIR